MPSNKQNLIRNHFSSRHCWSFLAYLSKEKLTAVFTVPPLFTLSKKILIRTSLVAQWIKDLILSLQWLGLLLWLMFECQTRNFHMSWTQPKKKKKKKKKNVKKVFFFFFLSFKGCTCNLWKFSAEGLNWSCTTGGLCHSHNNSRSNCVCHLHHSLWKCWILNPLVRPGIKPRSSWIPVRFVTTSHKGNSKMVNFIFTIFFGCA